MKFAGKLAGVGGKPGPKGTTAARGMTRGLVARLGMAGLIAGWGAGLVLLALGSAGIIMDNIKQRHDAGETGLWAKFNGILYGGDKAGGIANAMETAVGLAGPMAVLGFAFGGPAGAITGALIGLGVGGLTGYLGSDKFNQWGKDVNDWVHTNLSPTVWSLLDAINGILKDAVKPIEVLATAAAKAVRAAIVVNEFKTLNRDMGQFGDFGAPTTSMDRRGKFPLLGAPGFDKDRGGMYKKASTPATEHIPWVDDFRSMPWPSWYRESVSPIPSTPTQWSMIPQDYGQDDPGQDQTGMKGWYADRARELRSQYGDVKFKKGVTGEGLDIGIISRLKSVTSMFGKGGLTITSGFRSTQKQLAAMHAMLIADPKQYKKNYGDVSPEELLASGWKSKHMSGRAIDIRYPPSVIGASKEQKKDFVARLSKALPNATAVAEGDHIHVNFDVGKLKALAPSKSLAPSFQHWDSGGGPGRAKSDFQLEGLLRRSIPNYGTAPALTPDSAQTGGTTTIINAPDNSTAIATSTNNQLNQEPHWSVHHTPVYQRGRYAA